MWNRPHEALPVIKGDMRDIRFRAWDKKEKRMFEALSLMLPRIEFDTDSDIVMQFIGLKDKNGKEIYEGDILGSRIPEIDVKGEVEWHTNTASWQLVAYDLNRVVMIRFRFWGGPGYYELTNPDSLEIIGNIYENPELLK